jgi:hypothetical protein
VVAAATLAVAALFQPLRRWVQGWWIGGSTVVVMMPGR